MSASGFTPPPSGDAVETVAGSAVSGLSGASMGPGSSASGNDDSGELRASEWRPGDPLFADVPERGHCLNAGCGATWVPAGATTCPECGGFAGAACVLDESNDMEAFAALPECLVCGGMGKRIPPGFWGAESAVEDTAALERVARALALHDGHRWQSPEGKVERQAVHGRRRAIASRSYYLERARAAIQALRDGGEA